jgi:hypothetical protein
LWPSPTGRLLLTLLRLFLGLQLLPRRRQQ